MRYRKTLYFQPVCFLSISLTIFFLAVTAGNIAAQKSETPLIVTYSQNTKTVPVYEVFGITFEHQRQYDSPFSDILMRGTNNDPDV